MAMVYLLFNEGYAASGGEAHVRAPLCDEAIRLTRLLQRLFPVAPEVMGLAALLLLPPARTPARLGAARRLVLLARTESRLRAAARSDAGLSHGAHCRPHPTP